MLSLLVLVTVVRAVEMVGFPVDNPLPIYFATGDPAARHRLVVVGCAWPRSSGGIRRQCRITDQPWAALIRDLKQWGMLEDTLVIWGGEFGRTTYCQGKLSKTNYGRDHHPRCYTKWLAGGGIKPGTVYGETDDFSYNVVENPVHIHDLNATILHCLGINHEQLTFRHQGRDFRLTNVSRKSRPGFRCLVLLGEFNVDHLRKQVVR